MISKTAVRQEVRKFETLLITVLLDFLRSKLVAFCARVREVLLKTLSKEKENRDEREWKK